MSAVTTEHLENCGDTDSTVPAIEPSSSEEGQGAPVQPPDQSPPGAHRENRVPPAFMPTW